MKRKHPDAICEECPLADEGMVPTKFNDTEFNGVMFVGEAPGRNEVKKGVPFIGVSGKLLDAVLSEVSREAPTAETPQDRSGAVEPDQGVRHKAPHPNSEPGLAGGPESGPNDPTTADRPPLTRSGAVLTNTVLCRPPRNDNPPPEAIRCCAPRLRSEISSLNPDYVVTLGKIATSALMGEDIKITQERVGPPKQLPNKPYKLLPTVHPAACLYRTDLFPMLLNDIRKLTQVHVKWEPPQYKTFDNPTQARAAMAQIMQRTTPDSAVVLDLEVGYDKDDDFGHPKRILCAGIGYAPGKAVVLGRDAMLSTQVRQELATLLRNRQVVCQNAKYDLGVLHNMGIATLQASFDTMLASYVFDERQGTHGLKYLGQEILGTPDWSAELEAAGGFDGAPREELYRYNAYDVAVTWDIMEHFVGRMGLTEKKLHAFLVGASNTLMPMEAHGVQLDADALTKAAYQTEIDIQELRERIQHLVEQVPGFDPSDAIKGDVDEFNPNSVPQTRYFIEHIHTDVGSTAADVLERLTMFGAKKPILTEFSELMLEWREITKMYGTYIKGWLGRMDDDGRVHPTYKIHGTTTGRLSAANPNVQNPPRGDFRQFIIAPSGKVLIYADFGNIEGRVVCVLSGSRSMREALGEGRDIHSEVAEAIYGPNFTKEQRVLAKSVVHGTNYGRTPHGIASGLGVPISEAIKVDETYHKMFPEVRQWQAAVKHQVFKTEEPLETPFGRKRRFGLITRQNSEDVYKEALAFQPQSIASDICLRAGIRLVERGIDVPIFIHDGLLAEAPVEQAKDIAEEMVKVMEESGREFSEYVPFPVDVAMGRTWADCE